MADRPDPTLAPALAASGPHPAATVTESVVVDAELEDLWRTLTDGDELGRWLGAEVDLTVVPGARGVVVDDDGTRRVVEVDEVVAGRSLRWRWRSVGEDLGPTPEDHAGGWSIVEIAVAPVAGGFEVRVSETPTPSSPAVASACTAGAGADASGRWTGRLLGLELRHLRHRRPVAVGA